MLLVTGGAGFIGHWLARRAAAAGEPVRVLDDFSTGLRSNVDGLSGVEVIEGDITDPEALEASLAGVTRVAHLAAMFSVPRSEEEPELAAAVNARGTLEVLGAARRAGVSALVYASSCAVYGDAGGGVFRETDPVQPSSVYAVTKLAGERHVVVHHRTGGPPAVALRFFNVYGEGQRSDSPYSGVIARFTAAARAGERPEVHGDGGQTRDFVHVSDVCTAILTALDRAPEGAAGGEVINVGFGRRTSVLDIWGITAKAAGVDLEPRFAPVRAGDVRHAQADIGKARRLLDFRPRVRLEEGIVEVLAAS